jgi:hypothetical protein
MSLVQTDHVLTCTETRNGCGYQFILHLVCHIPYVYHELSVKPLAMSAKCSFVDKATFSTQNIAVGRRWVCRFSVELEFSSVALSKLKSLLQ